MDDDLIFKQLFSFLVDVKKLKLTYILQMIVEENVENISWICKVHILLKHNGKELMDYISDFEDFKTNLEIYQ